MPLQPPIEMTALPVASSRVAALWSPTTAAAHFDDVALSASVSAVLVAAHYKKITIGGQTVYDLSQPLS